MYIPVSIIVSIYDIAYCIVHAAHCHMQVCNHANIPAVNTSRETDSTHGSVRCNRPVQSFSRCTSPSNRTHGSRELRCLHACPSPPSVSAQLCDSPTAENHHKSYRRLKLNFMVSQGQMIKASGLPGTILII